MGVPTKDKEITKFKEWETKILNLLYFRTWGCMATVNVPINKKLMLMTKKCGLILLVYAIHNV